MFLLKKEVQQRTSFFCIITACFSIGIVYNVDGFLIDAKTALRFS